MSSPRRIANARRCHLSSCVFIICVCVLSGCGSKNQAPQPVVHNSSMNVASGNERNQLLSMDEARAIGREYFAFPNNAGVYAEDAGDAFYVAPPIMSRKHADDLAILISKEDGAITPYRAEGHRERLAGYMELIRSRSN